MKNHYRLPISLVVIAAIFVFSSCSSDEEPVPETTMQTLAFHLHSNVGDQEANYTSTFTDATGRTLTLTEFRYYLSNIVLIKSDGSELPMTGKVLLVDPINQDYEIGQVPSGDYKGLKFLFGLDSVTNHGDPSVYPAGDPLAIQSPSMHWNWNSGYLFLKIEGLCDTTLAANGTTDYPLILHIGMDEMRRTVDMSNHAFTVKTGEDKELAIDFDLQKVLTNVDLRTENDTHSFDNLPLATKIADNVPTAFNM